MVTYTYNVNANGFIKTIQQAVDQISTELRSNPTITDDIKILVGPGIYPAFSIPDGTTLPLLSTIYRLVIKSGGDYFPIIDAASTPEGIYVGADVRSANPQVTIKNLRLQNFVVGLRASFNSHNLLIDKCIFSNNRNAGILVDQCKQVAITQNIIVNGDYGVVSKLCGGIALIHNTIYVDGTYSNQAGIANTAAWLQLANDYGNGVTDTGRLYIVGNVIWNRVGHSLVLFKDDVNGSDFIRSNYNDIVKGSTELVALYDRVHVANQTTIPLLISNLLDWKQRTGRDINSKSQDPKFIQPVRSGRRRNSNFIDLALLPTSPVLGMVPSLFSDTTAAALYLPSYVDSASLAKDILGNDRLFGGTAAGANERSSAAGFFGQDVFIGPDSISLDKKCDLDPLNDIIFKELDVWFPTLKPGYFYSREREYYLYGKKAARQIGECAITEFQLPARIVMDKPIKVSVAGQLIKDPRYIDIRGDKVALYHYDLDIVDGNEEFEIEAYAREFINGTFVANQTHYRFKIIEGNTRFFLPPDYNSEGPVVVTDDRVAMTDDDRLANREFTLRWDEQEQREEIIFANYSNKFFNPQFDLVSTGNDIKYWSFETVSGAAAALYGGPRHRSPIMGDNRTTNPVDGYIRQVVPTNNATHCLSWHATYPSGRASASLITSPYYSVDFLNADFERLGYTIVNQYTPDVGTWTRFYAGFGETDPYPHLTPSVSHKVVGVNTGEYHKVPEGVAYADITFGFAGVGDMWLDCVQYEQSIRPTMYHRKFGFDELTVEYETTSDDFVDARQAISSARNLLSQGFLHIPELPATLYGGPNHNFVTTLHEWRWPAGRKYILPWARLSGKDKLKFKPNGIFSTIPEKHPEIISAVNSVAIPTLIRVSPDVPIARQGDRIGVGINIQVVDSYGNPYSMEIASVSIIDKMIRFPGWLHKKFYGIKEQLSTTVFGQLDNAGTIQVYWIPPDEYSTAYVGRVPKPTRTSNGERLSSIETNYAVNLELHGNVLVMDYQQALLPTKSETSIKATYYPKYRSTNSIISLDYPPTYGTVKVIVNGEAYTETNTNQPATNQFFVDYGESKIIINSRVDSVDIEYNPSYVYINPNDPYKINFYHDKVFGTYKGPIVVGYDAMFILNVEVNMPNLSDKLTRRFPLVAQNFLTSNRVTANVDSLDF